MHADDGRELSCVSFSDLENEYFLAFRRVWRIVFNRNPISHACKQKTFDTHISSPVFQNYGWLSWWILCYLLLLFGFVILFRKSICSLHIGFCWIFGLGWADDYCFHRKKWLENLGYLHSPDTVFFINNLPQSAFSR